MNSPLLTLLFAAPLLLLLSGCVATEPTCSQKDMQTLHQELSSIQGSLTRIESKKEPKYDESFTTLLQNQQEQKKLLKDGFEEISIKQNVTQNLLKEHSKAATAKPVVIYKDKKESLKFQDKLILGQEENVFIEPFGLTLRARIDTGADTSSIDAREITEFERDGQKWVRFSLIDRKTNKSYKMEKKVLRHVNIIQSSLAGKHDRRIVVKLKIKIGDFSDLSEFTLTNRDHMDFPVLIGRSFLQDIALVDVSGKDLAPIVKKGKK